LGCIPLSDEDDAIAEVVSDEDDAIEAQKTNVHNARAHKSVV
jgi:hypothetical protein